jgi:hypothetical protein
MSTMATRHGKELPVLPRTPADYISGQQEAPVVLTSLADMLTWAQNYTRSRSIWPFSYALACCGIEMIAAASAPQYDLGRFGSEVFRASPRQADAGPGGLSWSARAAHGGLCTNRVMKSATYAMSRRSDR